MAKHGNHKAAAQLYQELVALGDDNAYVAALVRSTAHVDLSAALAHASKLPPLAAAGGLDLAELESG
eukprot:CAMPEP_0198219288 /NCGR_PEP_ID=MMETSP1445-20131203/73495_1 /TAXON_ID=36898 /ORGANISM="Pyramimonas sp., Strain CCMP2087" /LENGTH=66 /DNA_ID=CAMNT_0043896635 /DNA_START=46 /DNA_END=243 /DNA_ORIENTATION=+